MLMALGMFVFETSTVPYQELQRCTEWRHASQSRVGDRPAYKFFGPDANTITLSGTLLPELTGGRVDLDETRDMAEQGRAWPLVEGTSRQYGYGSSPTSMRPAARSTAMEPPLKSCFGQHLYYCDSSNGWEKVGSIRCLGGEMRSGSDSFLTKGSAAFFDVGSSLTSRI
ncbi:hypothetical protein GCM10010082_05930 [Kushneria pakistanensis]|uniref:Phage tail protein n=1 Tax=Kushneria pakistanensis TaxID=1508770 RepID=A0ABQ3FBV7_9GAMM|nr:hypothetical protein GCM10010082_05930 [Kushneria pakistanensis]